MTKSWQLSAGLGLALSLAAAQQGLAADPADPAAPVPPTGYVSAFSSYQAYREEKVVPWRQVHDEVADQAAAADRGSHTAHASHGAAPPPRAAAPASLAESADAVRGRGVVRQVDKASGKIKMTHEPIAALGWPKMTMFFRLKDAALADQVKEGDQVEFFLEKAGSGYEISRLRQAAPGQAK